MNGPNGFLWLLVAFPIYLLANGKFVSYIQLLGTSAGTTGPATNPLLQQGLNNNQAIV